MKNLYNEADKNEILNRLENLKVDAVLLRILRKKSNELKS